MICRNCGIEFEPKKRGRKNTGFCCKKCADNWRQHNVYDLLPKRHKKVCQHCGEEFETNRENQKYCSVQCSRDARKTGRTVYNKTCLYCGKPFQTIYPKYKYCSSTCASRHAGDMRRGEYFCEYCGKPRYSDHPNRNRFCSRECAGKAKRLETLIKHEEQRRLRDRKMTRNCAYCGEVFQAKNGNQRFCTKECQYQSKLARARERNAESFIPQIMICPQCGKPFATTMFSQNKQYCSEKCRAKAADAKHEEKRKEQMRAAFVEPVGLKTTYRTYDGVCGICGLPVPETVEANNQWAATVDHITPLSKGGLHKKSNCQLAHRLCNSIKLDTVDDFRIDWIQKLRDEPGRWNEQLDDLWEQLGEEILDTG